MTRRLVDVAQDLIVREDDCGTTQGVVVEAFKDDKDGIIEPLYDRILGRYTNKKVLDPQTKEVIIDKNALITENIADKITVPKIYFFGYSLSSISPVAYY